MQTSKIIVIAGPTASGKSGLALDLALKLNSVIINADSMQVYKDIPILAATPSKEDTSIVPHKLYSIYDASYHGNVVEWLELCKKEIDKCLNNNQIPIIVGGTGLYLESLTKGVTPIPETPTEIRKHCENIISQKGLDYLYEELKKVDPLTASRLSPSDTTRIKRAIEVYTHTKTPLSHWHTLPLRQIYKEELFTKIYLKPNRNDLDENAYKRFDIMINQGAIQEVEHLLEKKLSDNLPCMRALGVQELKSYILGQNSLEDAIKQAKLHTRQYAKRQQTWFNNRFTPNFILNECYKNNNFFVEDIIKSL
jgi:tRNA dimethylallyltransferase